MSSAFPGPTTFALTARRGPKGRFRPACPANGGFSHMQATPPFFPPVMTNDRRVIHRFATGLGDVETFLDVSRESQEPFGGSLVIGQGQIGEVRPRIQEPPRSGAAQAVRPGLDFTAFTWAWTLPP